MSLPKLNDFIGKATGKAEYKRVSLIHSIKNSFTRSTIIESCKKTNKSHVNPLQTFQAVQNNNSLMNSLQNLQPPSSFKYEQKMPASFTFSTEDMYKLLEHLFNKKTHDFHDRNFIRRLMLKHFPEQLICAGGRDFVSLLKFDKLRKDERKIFDDRFLGNNPIQQSSELHKSTQKNFYFILKGKVRVFTQQFTYKKSSGEYFGELEILGRERISQIEAKADTMLIYLSEQIFSTHLAKYFINIYSEMRKKLSLFEPILDLAPSYNQYKFFQHLYEKDYRTGDKIYQKGDQIKEIIFLNHTEISSSEDKLLNEFKTVGLGQILTMQRPRARQTTYCMDNKIVYAIKANDLTSFIGKGTISSFVTQNYNFMTLSPSKIVPTAGDGALSGHQNFTIDTFVNVKQVKFTNNKRRVLTQPNLSILMGSPTTGSKLTHTYPEYATPFIFIKENSSLCFAQMKSNRLNSLTGGKQRRRNIKEYLVKTRDSFREKRWLDEIDTMNQNSVICNPEKMAKYEVMKHTKE